METTTPSPPLKPLTSSEFETLINDYNNHGQIPPSHDTITGPTLIQLSLSTLTRKDTPLSLKLHVIIFLEQHITTLLHATSSLTIQQTLTSLLDTLGHVISQPIDHVSVTCALKEQLLVSITSIFILLTIDNEFESQGLTFGSQRLTFESQLEGLVEVLLGIVNRSSYGWDRGLRGVACECLSELEKECNGLLCETVGHLWNLCQNEKTHVGQSYVLMLANVVKGIVVTKVNVSVFGTAVPLVPFNVPKFLSSERDKDREGLGVKDLRRVMSFLLEWPQFLTTVGLFEFMSIVMPIAVELDLQASLLKVKFSGLLYTFDMLLCHAFLGMFLQLPDAFSGQGNEVISRLMLISKEKQHVLVFRLLALHWLLGFMGLVMSKRKVIKQRIYATALRFYPSVFDPLALKALKLDLIAYCSILLDMSRLDNANGHIVSDVGSSEVSVVKLFEDGLKSVSGFKWLPQWST
ncbi:AP-5 complex subunit beta-1 like protein [Tanacetum coccineum]